MRRQLIPLVISAVLVLGVLAGVPAAAAAADPLSARLTMVTGNTLIVSREPVSGTR